MEVPAAYQQLVARAKEITLIRSTSQVLQWDEQTYLPEGAAAFRAEQISYLEGKAHGLFTEPAVGDWLKACENAGFAPDSDEAANIREWRRDYDRLTKLPVEFVERFELAAAHAREAWKAARQTDRFADFAPHLQTIVTLSREKADRFGYEDCRYDALLSQFEPGAKTAELRPVFAELREALVGLVRQIGQTANPDPLRAQYPIAGQQGFNDAVARAFGYSFAEGRIDTTTHPFATSLGPADHRITTRYDEEHFSVSLYGVMHETGHALYEQGLRKEAFGLPVGESVSLGIHESQSRLWENHVGRTVGFWRHWYPTAVEHLPELRRFTAEEIAQGLQTVTPSLIRVEADEVTYDLHILLRFELETELINGSLAIEDLPARWNETFAELFGIDVPNDRLGVLQDIHWSMGAVGYFPTYTLGNLNAAQLMDAAEKQVPGLNDAVAAGNYQPLLNWLRTNVHQPGRKFLPPELMRSTTGEPTNAKYRIAYLRRKYAPSGQVASSQ